MKWLVQSPGKFSSMIWKLVKINLFEARNVVLIFQISKQK